MAPDDIELGSSPAPPADAPTVASRPLKLLTDIAQSYLTQFGADSRRKGQFAVIRGEHGAGKTHAIFYLKRRIDSGALRPRSDPALEPDSRLPIQLYAKADDAQILEVCQRLLANLSFELVCDLCRKHFHAVAGEQIKDNTALSGRVADVLRGTPERLTELFDLATLDKGAVQEQQAQEIHNLVRKGGEDLQRAVSFLSGSETTLARGAYDWLVGDRVSPEMLRKLGVIDRIEDSDIGRAAIRVFLRLFRRADQPFIIYIDQYENLTITPDTDRAKTNSGWLRSLAEDIPTENGLFVLSGSEAAWNILPADIVSRVPDWNQVALSAWSLKQAQQLVKLYVTPPAMPFDPAAPARAEDLFPFTTDGVRKILELGTGNVRRFLQIAALVLDQALPSQLIIDSEFVTEITKQTKRLYFDRASVLAEVEAALLKFHLPFKKSYDFEDVNVDFAVQYPGEELALLVRVSKSLFSRDDHDITLSHLNLIRKLNTAASPARFLLIIAGYLNPDSVPKIRLFVHDLIVYRPDTFAVQINAALARIPAAPVAAPAADRASLLKEIAVLRESVEAFRDQQRKEDEVLAKRATGLVEVQKNQLAERWNSLRRDWSRELETIETRIKEAREERKKKLLDELDRLRATSERQRTISWAVIAVLVAVFFGAVGIYAEYQFAAEQDAYKEMAAAEEAKPNPPTPNESAASFLARKRQQRDETLMQSFAGIGFSLAILGFGFGIGRPRVNRELASTAMSLQELTKVARGYNQVDTVRLSSWFGYSGLDNNNPNFRFAAALRWRGDAEKVLFAYEAERSAIVRHQMARSFGFLSYHLDSDRITEAEDREYAWEGYARRDSRSARQDSYYPPEPIRFDRVFHLIRPTTLAAEMLRAVDTGMLDRPLLDKSEVPAESELRRIIRRLSPLEPGGVGTFDELTYIDEVDAAYCAARQLLFYFERDAFAQSTL